MASQLWFFYALGAAVLWGIGYVLVEKLLHMGMTPSFLVLAEALISIPILLALSVYLGHLKPGIEHALASWQMGGLLVVLALTVVGGNYLITMSVNEKNATLTALVEIAYPLFTFIFAWLILKEVQLNWEAALGGLFIFAGIALIYWKS